MLFSVSDCQIYFDSFSFLVVHRFLTVSSLAAIFKLRNVVIAIRRTLGISTKCHLTLINWKYLAVGVLEKSGWQKMCAPRRSLWLKKLKLEVGNVLIGLMILTIIKDCSRSELPNHNFYILILAYSLPISVILDIG